MVTWISRNWLHWISDPGWWQSVAAIVQAAAAVVLFFVTKRYVRITGEQAAEMKRQNEISANQVELARQQIELTQQLAESSVEPSIRLVFPPLSPDRNVSIENVGKVDARDVRLITHTIQSPLGGVEPYVTDERERIAVQFLAPGSREVFSIDEAFGPLIKPRGQFPDKVFVSFEVSFRRTGDMKLFSFSELRRISRGHQGNVSASRYANQLLQQ